MEGGEGGGAHRKRGFGEKGATRREGAARPEVSARWAEGPPGVWGREVLSGLRGAWDRGRAAATRAWTRGKAGPRCFSREETGP